MKKKNKNSSSSIKKYVIVTVVVFLVFVAVLLLLMFQNSLRNKFAKQNKNYRLFGNNSQSTLEVHLDTGLRRL